MNGKVIVSWLNDYTKPLENIIIQRSYDSLGNFKSIIPVLNPQNKENGYPDMNAPYSKMYYRVFISFENGEYVYGPSVKAISANTGFKPVDFTDLPEEPQELAKNTDIIADSITIIEDEPLLTLKKIESVEIKKEKPKNINTKIDSVKTIQIKKTIENVFPSTKIFSNRLNNLIIQLPDYLSKKYQIKFFDETDNLLFEIKKISDDYLIMEKSNFMHSGWFHFEIYEDGLLIEKNKFFINKDVKPNK